MSASQGPTCLAVGMCACSLRDASMGSRALRSIASAACMSVAVTRTEAPGTCRRGAPSCTRPHQITVTPLIQGCGAPRSGSKRSERKIAEKDSACFRASCRSPSGLQ